MSTLQQDYARHNMALQDIHYALLGEIPLLPGEDPLLLDQLWQEVHTILQPIDFIDKIYARDIVKLLWEERRLYRLKAEFLKSSSHLGLELILQHHVDYSSRKNFIARWVQGDPETVEVVNAILVKSSLTREAITAETFVIKLRELENIDRMIANHEERRNKALRELTIHRELVQRSLIALAHRQHGPIPVPDE
jgi:hypothetical protein